MSGAGLLRAVIFFGALTHPQIDLGADRLLVNLTARFQRFEYQC